MTNPNLSAPALPQSRQQDANPAQRASQPIISMALRQLPAPCHVSVHTPVQAEKQADNVRSTCLFCLSTATGTHAPAMLAQVCTPATVHFKPADHASVLRGRRWRGTGYGAELRWAAFTPGSRLYVRKGRSDLPSLPCALSPSRKAASTSSTLAGVAL